MDESVAKNLKIVVRERGTQIGSDPERLDGFLRELSPVADKEIFLLVRAAQKRIPAALLNAKTPVAKETLIERLTGMGLDAPAAEWAVNAWTDALTRAPGEPELLKEPPPPPPKAKPASPAPVPKPAPKPAAAPAPVTNPVAVAPPPAPRRQSPIVPAVILGLLVAAALFFWLRGAP
jgi:hypothetical protein